MLEPKCHDRNYAFPTLVSVNAYSNKLKNIHISKVNDMFTPKPAKLDKHIHIYYILYISCIYIYINTDQSRLIETNVAQQSLI